MESDAKKPDELSVPDGFFKGVKYYLIGSIDEKVRKKVKNILHFSHVQSGSPAVLPPRSILPHIARK